jgi:hypothetical protein
MTVTSVNATTAIPMYAERDLFAPNTILSAMMTAFAYKSRVSRW